MRTRATLGWLALGLALAAPAGAQDTRRLQTTADLLQLCDATAVGHSAVGLGQCNGFIAGTGLLYLELVQAGIIKRWACAPETTTLDEVRAAFVGWAKGNPARLSSEVTDGFWAAMSTRWPCSS